MRYFRTHAFLESFVSLPKDRQKRVGVAMKKLDALLSAGNKPFGLGLKHLRHGIWEIRAGLSDRILFKRVEDTLEFLIVGSHDDIHRFLKKN